MHSNFPIRKSGSCQGILKDTIIKAGRKKISTLFLLRSEIEVYRGRQIVKYKNAETQTSRKEQNRSI